MYDSVSVFRLSVARSSSILLFRTGRGGKEKPLMPADGASLRARLSLPLLVFLAVVGVPCRSVLFVN